MCYCSLRRREPRGLPRLDQAGRRVPGLGARQEQEEQEAPRSVLQGPDAGAGEALPPAALPVRAREGAAGAAPRPDADPGEDLVPEPPLQDEEGPGGRGAAARGRGDGAPAPGAAQARRPDPGAGREALPHLPTGLGESRLFARFLSGGALPLGLPGSAASLPARPASQVPALSHLPPGLQIRLEGLLERPGPL